MMAVESQHGSRHMNKYVILMMALCVLARAAASEESSDIVGVIGMNPVGTNSSIAVYVSLEEGQALAGVEWYITSQPLLCCRSSAAPPRSWAGRVARTTMRVSLLSRLMAMTGTVGPRSALRTGRH